MQHKKYLTLYTQVLFKKIVVIPIVMMKPGKLQRKTMQGHKSEGKVKSIIKRAGNSDLLIKIKQKKNENPEGFLLNISIIPSLQMNGILELKISYIFKAFIIFPDISIPQDNYVSHKKVHNIMSQ